MVLALFVRLVRKKLPAPVFEMFTPAAPVSVPTLKVPAFTARVRVPAVPPSTKPPPLKLRSLVPVTVRSPFKLIVLAAVVVMAAPLVLFRVPPVTVSAPAAVFPERPRVVHVQRSGAQGGPAGISIHSRQRQRARIGLRARITWPPEQIPNHAADQHITKTGRPESLYQHRLSR